MLIDNQNVKLHAGRLSLPQVDFFYQEQGPKNIPLLKDFLTSLSHRKKVSEQCFLLGGLNHTRRPAKTQNSNERQAEDGVRGAMTHRVSTYTSQCSPD